VHAACSNKQQQEPCAHPENCLQCSCSPAAQAACHAISNWWMLQECMLLLVPARLLPLPGWLAGAPCSPVFHGPAWKPTAALPCLGLDASPSRSCAA
jgi:hypothetical protein